MENKLILPYEICGCIIQWWRMLIHSSSACDYSDCWWHMKYVIYLVAFLIIDPKSNRYDGLQFKYALVACATFSARNWTFWCSLRHENDL